jgi:ribosomal protein L24
MENDYQANPIEGFGKKILMKQGWFHGRGIGKTAAGEIAPFSSYTGRSERSGLGSDKEFINRQKSTLKTGDLVEVVRGKHAGVIGTLVRVEDEAAVVEIRDNVKALKVPITLIALTQKSLEGQNSVVKKQLRWVIPDLIVRVRSKTVYKGSLYGCKGTIEDVIDQFSFSLKINGKVYEDLTEKDLETVIPSPGKTIRIVRGPHKGEVCKLLSRNKSQNQVTLQCLNEILSLKQDDICDFLHSN